MANIEEPRQFGATALPSFGHYLGDRLHLARGGFHGVVAARAAEAIGTLLFILAIGVNQFGFNLDCILVA